MHTRPGEPSPIPIRWRLNYTIGTESASTSGIAFSLSAGKCAGTLPIQHPADANPSPGRTRPDLSAARHQQPHSVQDRCRPTNHIRGIPETKLTDSPQRLRYSSPCPACTCASWHTVGTGRTVPRPATTHKIPRSVGAVGIAVAYWRNGADTVDLRIERGGVADESTLAKLIALGDLAHSTPGFLPPAVYRDEAAKGRLLAAFADDTLRKLICGSHATRCHSRRCDP